MKILIFLHTIDETEASMSSSGLKRTQSMRPLIHQSRTEPQTQSRRSSSSSAASVSEHQHIEESRNPVASTSNSKQVKFEEEMQRLRSASTLNVNLEEAVRATNAEHLDPTRDGVYARLNHGLAKYGVAVVVGSALTVGAFELINRTFPATATTTTTTTAASISENSNEIENLL